MQHVVTYHITIVFFVFYSCMVSYALTNLSKKNHVNDLVNKSFLLTCSVIFNLFDSTFYSPFLMIP